MALTLETGEGLPDADSLVTLEEVRAFATSRGETVSDDDDVLEAEIRKAHDYLATKEQQLKGYRRTEGQALPYPRNDVVIYGYLLDTGEIPIQAKNAIAQIVIEGETTELLATSDGKVVIEETVGPISTKYAASGASSTTPVLPRVDNFLQPLLRNTGPLSSLRV